MSLSVYHAVVPTFLQMLGVLDGLVSKAEEHCKTNDLDEKTLLEAALAPDMFGFSTQIHQAVSHSGRALKMVQGGVFGPDISPPPTDFSGLHTILQTAISDLKALNEADVNSIEGKPMKFEFGEHNMKFVAEEFLLTFSQPNFFFHVTTAYAILRAQGLALGKGDYMGAMRMVP